jgi:acetate kinase
VRAADPSALVLNAGSSSLKFSVIALEGRRVRARGEVDWAGTQPRFTRELDAADPHTETVPWSRPGEAARGVLRSLRSAIDGSGEARITVAAHRIVHGGLRFTEPVRVTPEVRQTLAELSALAPLHNPASLEVLDAATAELPEVPQIAIFDTAFHATLGPEAFTYPIPAEWTERWELRRFGFHGLSHAYAALRAAEMLGRPAEGSRVVVAHLGHGASVTAVADGKSVDTSMGFTPLEGLMMGTRSGSVDPGLLLHLQLRCGIDASELESALNDRSGLLGVSGLSGDMRQVLAASRDHNERAELAVSIFVHRARQAIGAMAVTLGAVDALVFTGGIGEHSAEIRARVCRGLACLGLELDAERNGSVRPDADVAARSSRGRVLVVSAREDLMMAREALAVSAP